MKIKYQNKKFSADALQIIRDADRIAAEYARQGYDLTLRQLYYRFIALDLFPDDRRWRWTGTKWVRDPNGTKNAQPNYKWMGDVIGDGRLAGLIDWDHIVDRTREVESNSHWKEPGEVIKAAASSYALDKWEGQEYRVEVWVEKDALIQVIERAARDLDVPFMSCRGYTSLSTMWAGAMRLLAWIREGYKVVIIHLGDHDPSGVDMTRDVLDRILMFVVHHLKQDYVKEHKPPRDLEGKEFETWVDGLREHITPIAPLVERIALNMEQIEEYNPPPSPAKTTDSRSGKYIEQFGEDSWELDALEPDVLVGLIRGAIDGYRDKVLWDGIQAHEEAQRMQIEDAADRWPEVVEMLEK